MTNHSDTTGCRVRIDGSPGDIESLNQLVQRARGTPLYQAPPDVSTLRAAFRGFAASPLARKAPEGTVIDDAHIGGIHGLWIKAPNASRRLSLLYLHGGAYVCGSVEATSSVAAAFSHALQCPVLAIEYRQAPEHVFPAALDDVLTAARWLATETDTPFLLGGDSAGGGLAVAAAVDLGGGRSPRPVGVIAISGVFDLTLSSMTWQTNATRDLISPAIAPFFYGLYLGAADPRDPRASPVFADLRALPPTLIIAGEAECLLGDSEMLASAASAQGCDTQFEIYTGAPHNFTKFDHPVADAAWERISAWSRARFPGS